MKSMRAVVALLVGLAVVVGGATQPVLAADGPDVVIGANELQDGLLPPSWMAEDLRPYYLHTFSSATEAPWGRVVADSGFRPFPNGFSFANSGATLDRNQRIFGQPKPWVDGQESIDFVPLNSASMRATFGDGVCVPGQDLTNRAGCRLTKSATEVMRFANDWGAGGKCFGFAMAAQAL